MTVNDVPVTRNLRATLESAEVEVQLLLSAQDTPVLDVVTWLSAHLAALDHAVYPVVRRSLPDGRAIVAAHRQQVSRISHLLRVLERHHSGDILAASVDSQSVVEELRPLVADHYRAVSALVGSLSEVLDQPAQEALAANYERALRAAPTRPHPHLVHAGPLTPVVFWMGSARDRILDTMDGRHIPVPRRTRRQTKPGLWGSYWLGQPQHDDEPDA
jgi:hypothetical protein